MYKQQIFICTNQQEKLYSIETKNNNEVLLTYQDGTTSTVRERTEEEKQKDIIKKKYFSEKLNKLMSSVDTINNRGKNTCFDTSVCED